MLAFEKYTLYTIQGGKLLAGPYENYRDLLETVKLMMQMMMGWCCGKFEKLDKVGSRRAALWELPLLLQITAFVFHTLLG